MLCPNWGFRGSDAGITNSWTRFNRFRSYATMSIEPSLLSKGKHALGLHIGQGFCDAFNKIGRELVEPCNHLRGSALYAAFCWMCFSRMLETAGSISENSFSS